MSSEVEEEDRSGRALWKKCIQIVREEVLSKTGAGARKLQFMDEHFLFRDLHDETKKRLAGKIHEIKLHAQQYLFKRNYYPMDVYFLVEGQLTVTANLKLVAAAPAERNSVIEAHTQSQRRKRGGNENLYQLAARAAAKSSSSSSSARGASGRTERKHTRHKHHGHRRKKHVQRKQKIALHGPYIEHTFTDVNLHTGDSLSFTYEIPMATLDAPAICGEEEAMHMQLRIYNTQSVGFSRLYAMRRASFNELLRLLPANMDAVQDVLAGKQLTRKNLLEDRCRRLEMDIRSKLKKESRSINNHESGKIEVMLRKMGTPHMQRPHSARAQPVQSKAAGKHRTPLPSARTNRPQSARKTLHQAKGITTMEFSHKLLMHRQMAYRARRSLLDKVPSTKAPVLLKQAKTPSKHRRSSTHNSFLFEPPVEDFFTFTSGASSPAGSHMNKSSVETKNQGPAQQPTAVASVQKRAVHFVEQVVEKQAENESKQGENPAVQVPLASLAQEEEPERQLAVSDNTVAAVAPQKIDETTGDIMVYVDESADIAPGNDDADASGSEGDQFDERPSTRQRSTGGNLDAHKKESRVQYRVSAARRPGSAVVRSPADVQPSSNHSRPLSATVSETDVSKRSSGVFTERNPKVKELHVRTATTTAARPVSAAARLHHTAFGTRSAREPVQYEKSQMPSKATGSLEGYTSYARMDAAVTDVAKCVVALNSEHVLADERRQNQLYIRRPLSATGRSAAQNLVHARARQLNLATERYVVDNLTVSEADSVNRQAIRAHRHLEMEHKKRRPLSASVSAKEISQMRSSGAARPLSSSGTAEQRFQLKRQQREEAKRRKQLESGMALPGKSRVHLKKGMRFWWLAGADGPELKSELMLNTMKERTQRGASEHNPDHFRYSLTSSGSRKYLDRPHSASGVKNYLRRKIAKPEAQPALQHDLRIPMPDPALSAQLRRGLIATPKAFYSNNTTPVTPHSLDGRARGFDWEKEGDEHKPVMRGWNLRTKDVATVKNCQDSKLIVSQCVHDLTAFQGGL